MVKKDILLLLITLVLVTNVIPYMPGKLAIFGRQKFSFGKNHYKLPHDSTQGVDYVTDDISDSYDTISEEQENI